MQKFVAAVLAATLVISVPVLAQEPEHVIKFNHVAVDDPVRNPTAAYAEVFKDTLERLTAGRMKVDIYPNGQLGDQGSAVQQVRRGTIHVADIATGVLASLYYPKLGVVDLPFLFDSRAHVREALNNENEFTKALIEEVAEQTGIRILSLAPYGFRHFTNSGKPIQSAEDMAGLKMRTMEILPHQRMMQALGASPVPIPWLELYTSMQTGVVDGGENTLQNINTANLYQVQDNLTLTGHLMTIGGFIVNERWYQALSEDLRSAIVHADLEARLAYDGVGAIQDTLSLATLKEKGMNVTAPSADEIRKFRELTSADLRAWAEAEYGLEFVSQFFENLEASRQRINERSDSTAQ